MEDNTPYTVGFVNVPEEREGLKSSGEGGVEFWLIIREVVRENDIGVRGVCITGFSPGIVSWDSVISDGFGNWLRNQEYDAEYRGISRRVSPRVECAVCIGATTLSLWDEGLKRYWEPTIDNLRPDGQTMWKLLKDLYNVEPEIVTVLDT